MLVRSGFPPQGSLYDSPEPRSFIVADGETCLGGGQRQTHMTLVCQGQSYVDNYVTEIGLDARPYEAEIQEWDILIGHPILWHYCIQQVPRFNMCRLHAPWPELWLSD